jgi:photosystem II stability/assembly factor-like uncharacterized protein
MAILAIIGTPMVWAEINVWSGIGPYGSSARALAIDPQNPGTVYAGTSGGVFKTTNGGTSWNVSNSGLPTGYIARALVVDPQDPNTIYAGGACGAYGPCGIFKSTDGGANWHPINSGLENTVIVVESLAIDPQNSSTLYAGTTACFQASGAAGYVEGGENLCYRPAVFKTTDGGMGWSNASSGLPLDFFEFVDSLVIDPQNSGTLYAAVDHGGIFKSTDEGVSWANSLMASGAKALAINPQDGSTLYAANWSGMVKSTNGGADWKAVSSGLPANCCGSLAIDPQAPDTIYVGGYSGVFRSTDGGANWTNTGVPFWLNPISYSVNPPNPSAGLAVDPQSSAIVYAATLGGGIFKSTDRAMNWSAVNSGLSATEVFSSAIDPHDPRTMYAATTTGLLKTTDGGASWSAASSFQANQVAIDPQNTSTIYAGMRYSQPGEIFKSTDGGATWNSLTRGAATGPGIGSFSGPLAVDPQNPGALFVGGSLSSGAQSNPWGLFESTDGGSTWTHTSFGNDVTAVAFDGQNAGTLYVGALWRVLKSTDEGSSWTDLSLPQDLVPDDCDECVPVRVLAVDPRKPNTIYVGGTTGLWKSADGGASWNVMNSGLTLSPTDWQGVTALVIDPQRSDNVYAAIGNTVFRSTDGAASWKEVTAGLTVTSISNLMIDSKDPRTIYAATAGGGMFAITFVP